MDPSSSFTAIGDANGSDACQRVLPLESQNEKSVRLSHSKGPAYRQDGLHKVLLRLKVLVEIADDLQRLLDHVLAQLLIAQEAKQLIDVLVGWGSHMCLSCVVRGQLSKRDQARR
jgi:hypothetical protein